MRITVNLSMFFHDHRSFAKIFVNKKMKCIRDVEEHIAGVFKIQDFYLKCDNQFLPPTEDIQILQYDDVVWAVPTAADQVEANKEEVTVEKKKKKKKKRLDTEEDKKLIQSAEETTEVEVPKIKSKKKKKRIADTDPQETPPCVNVTKRRRLKSPQLTADGIKDSGRGSLDSSRSDDSENKNLSVKSLVNSFELKNFTPTGPQKRVNIVKTIIISNGEKEIVKPEVETQNNEELMDQSELDTSSVACSSMNDTDHNVNKRKRKRTRRRRTKSTIGSNTEISEQPVYSFIPRALIVQNPNHLRFEDEAQPKPEQTEEVKTNENVIVLDNSVKTEQHEEVETEANGTGIINLENCSYDSKEIEECIAKQPITHNSQPKMGDVIAFKMLRVSENYTPEISSTIVGKVVGYKSENQEISFEILYGHQQCSLPTGKFSLDADDPPVEDTSKLQCPWSSLLEPRLIYP